MTKNKALSIALIVIATLAVLANNAKPKQKGLIPATAGTFQNSSSEEMLIYYDLDRDGKYSFH